MCVCVCVPRWRASESFPALAFSAFFLSGLVLVALGISTLATSPPHLLLRSRPRFPPYSAQPAYPAPVASPPPRTTRYSSTRPSTIFFCIFPRPLLRPSYSRPPTSSATMTTPARRRLMRDFKRLQTDPPEGISGAPCENNIMMWHAVIFGYVHARRALVASGSAPRLTPPRSLASPDDTAWEGGTFKLQLEFSEDYPNKAPKVKFLSKMFHPNGTSSKPLRALSLSLLFWRVREPRLTCASLSAAVYADGSICLDILQNQWSPIYDIAAVLTSIQVRYALALSSFHPYRVSERDLSDSSSPGCSRCCVTPIPTLLQTRRPRACIRRTSVSTTARFARLSKGAGSTSERALRPSPPSQRRGGALNRAPTPSLAASSLHHHVVSYIVHHPHHPPCIAMRLASPTPSLNTETKPDYPSSRGANTKQLQYQAVVISRAP